MRRPKVRTPKREAAPRAMSRELDWAVDRWQQSTPEERMKLLLAKIRHEEGVQER